MQDEHDFISKKVTFHRREAEETGERAQFAEERVNMTSSREKGIPASPVTTTPPTALPTTPVSSPVIGGHAKLLSMVDEGDESVESTPSKPPPLAPESLAKKIQDLIDSMPLPQPGEEKSIPIIKNSKPPDRDKDGRPIPPPNATPVKDPKSPLIPDHKDLVELAEPVDLKGNSVDGDSSSNPVAGTSSGQVWLLSAIWNLGSIASTSKAALDVVISGTRTSVDGNGNTVRIWTTLAWVPADTKLYLPPPVLEILDDNS
ncbi:hypothetical protein BJ165DRAFT_1409501 [Panaeolus papilionaceus]|nr:hypothetical protein BJ165DRAFT_1409501 [Panaeolus papilionaceus]